ncbi:MAG: hypothetical protein ACJ74F_25060 [Mycobacterium sp.]|uniref:hypothetical protein n=1 Tax=Mycobacterium sp. TaxID=1785 RepID=UPI00389B1F31
MTILIGAPRRSDEPSINLGSFSMPYPVFSLFPGMAVGAIGARTVGVNLFPPVGLMLFSVGAGGGDPGVGDCVVVVVVVGDWVVDGAFEPLPLQLAIEATIPASTATPATRRARRAAFKFSIMTSPID